MFNKRAQVGGTMTWVVATLVIVVILIISISVVSFHLKNKEFKTSSNSDLLISKSFMGYLLSDDNYNKLKNQEVPTTVWIELEKQTRSSAKNLFSSLYTFGKIDKIWIGIVNKNVKFGIAQPIAPRTSLAAANTKTNENLYYDFIELNENYLAELLISYIK